MHTNTQTGTRTPWLRAERDPVDRDFAVGAARYLRNAGLRPAEICASLVAELGMEASEARRLVHHGHVPSGA